MESVWEMRKIAVCDESPLILKQVVRVVNRVYSSIICEEYSELKNLLLTIKSGEQYLMVIISIEWNGQEKGIEAAHQIQELDSSIRIIYMTGYTEKYVQQIFLKSANISGFLIKPIEETILEENLWKLKEEEQEREKKSLFIKYKGIMYSILFDDISYLESEGHMITIHTKTGKRNCYDRLEKLCERLPECFIQCHKSYVVNMNKIQKIEKRLMMMNDHIEIPISKARYKDTKVQYIQYMNACHFS